MEQIKHTAVLIIILRQLVSRTMSKLSLYPRTQHGTRISMLIYIRIDTNQVTDVIKVPPPKKKEKKEEKKQKKVFFYKYIIKQTTKNIKKEL